MRIEISGGIGTGKTTLARCIVGHAAGFELVSEDYRANPFWSKFYVNPTEYEFSKNLYFFMATFDAVRSARPAAGGTIVCDFALLQNLAYADMSRDRRDVAVLEAAHRRLGQGLEPPAVIVHLSCPPGLQLERIRRRARLPELALTEAYLTDLNAAILRRLREGAGAGLGPGVVEIDTGRTDYASNAGVAGRVCAEVMDVLRSRAPRVDPAS